MMKVKYIHILSKMVGSFPKKQKKNVSKNIPLSENPQKKALANARYVEQLNELAKLKR